MDENDKLQLTALRTNMENLIRAVNEIKEQIKGLSDTHISKETFEALKSRVQNVETSHITKEAFDAIRDRVSLMEKIVFGGLGVVIVTVLGAVLMLVIRQ